jgi:malonyl-CoA O-methyltransferase
MNFSNITTPILYQSAAFLAQEAGKALLSRFDLMKLDPHRVLDLGCGVGGEVLALSHRFSQAQVLGVDLSHEFLCEGQRPFSFVQADASILPFRSDSVDIIYSNMLLPWCANPLAFLREWRRVLRPDGLVIFSCLGPGSFREMTSGEFLPNLVDMHDVGDALLKEGMIDPVLEVEDITLNYRSEEQMQQELEHSGMLKANTLLPGGARQVTFEIIYAHAWCPAAKGFKADDKGEVRIPLAQLRK